MSSLKIVEMILVSYVLGFVAAIPIGAAQIEVAKRALSGRLGPAFLTAAGSITSDMLYGLLALFGIAPFLERPSVVAAFGWVGAVVLGTLSVLLWRQAEKVHAPDPKARWAGHGMSYLTGFTVGITYPPIMVTWLFGATLVKHLGLVPDFTPTLRVAFVLSGGAGLFSYPALLAVALKRTHHYFSDRAMRRLYKGLAILLGLLGLVFLVGGILKTVK